MSYKSFSEFKNDLSEVRNKSRIIKMKTKSLKTLREDKLATVYSGAIDYSKERLQTSPDPDKALIYVIDEIDRDAEKLIRQIEKLKEEIAPTVELIEKRMDIGGEILRLYFLEGRILIAEVILNRLNDPRFGCDSITEVLTAPGQFSTVRRGQSVTGRTDLSDEAVRIAISEVENGTAPAVLFFNCIGYNYGEPYGDGPIDGNYFMTLV